MENLWMQILADASRLGGFAGLVAAVMMIWVLRQQAAMQRAVEQRLSVEAQAVARQSEEEARMTRMIFDELVLARRETLPVIQANTKAWTEAVAALQELCAQMAEHDDHARDMELIIRGISKDGGE